MVSWIDKIELHVAQFHKGELDYLAPDQLLRDHLLQHLQYEPHFWPPACYIVKLPPARLL